jgi:hypothetical protein
MVPLTALWLPIVVSAVLVFIASSILHMVLPFHRNDYKKLPNEDGVLDALRTAGIPPGDYFFPRPSNPKDMSSQETIERFKKGPVGLLTVIPNGPPVLPKHLGQWFVLCLVLSYFVAYLTGRTLGPGAEYLRVFQIAGCAAFLAYAGCCAADSIWKGIAWSTTFKHIFDGLIYALLTAGAFGWLWP